MITYMWQYTLVTIFLLLLAIMQNMVFYGRWNPWHVADDEKQAWETKAVKASKKQVPFTTPMPIGFWFPGGEGVTWNDLAKLAPDYYNQATVSSFASQSKVLADKTGYKVITNEPHALKAYKRTNGVRKQMKKRQATLPRQFRNWLQWARRATCRSLGLPATTPDACKGDDYNPADDVDPGAQPGEATESDLVAEGFSCVKVGEHIKRSDPQALACGTWHLFKAVDLASDIDFADALPKRYSLAHLHLPKDVDEAKLSALMANVIEGSEFRSENGKLTMMVWSF